MQAPIRKLQTKRLKNKISRKLTKNKTQISNFFFTFFCCKSNKIEPVTSQTNLESSNGKKKLAQKSLYIIPIGSKFNKKTQNIVRSKPFNLFIHICIISQIFVIWLDSPLEDPNSDKRVRLNYLDQFFTGVFTLELVLKVIVQGFLYCGKSSYMRQNWNILDFLIVVFSLTPLILKNVDQQFKYTAVFRVIKLLKPFRMISRSESLKVALISLFKSMSKINSVIAISFMFFTLLSIIAINQFKGSYNFCQIDFVSFEPPEIDNKWECISAGGDWKAFKSNFDNFGMANLTIFHMMTTAGWAEVMYNGINARGPDLVGERMHRPLRGYFFLVIMLVTSFFVRKLFIGIVISTYNRVKERQSKDYLISTEQKTWLQIKLMILRSNPQLRPTEPVGRLSKLRGFFFKVVNTKEFDYCTNLLIILNSAVMTFKWLYMPPVLL